MDGPGMSFEIVRSAPTIGARSDRGAIAALMERGPGGGTHLVRGAAELERTFGGPAQGMLGARAARAFFANGGEELVVARIVPPGARAAEGALPLNGLGAASCPLRLREPGAFGNAMRIDARLHVRRRGAATCPDGAPFRVLPTGAPGRPEDVGRAILVTGSEGRWWSVISAVSGDSSYVLDPVMPYLGLHLAFAIYEESFTLVVREPDRTDVVIGGVVLGDVDALDAALAGSPIERAAAFGGAEGLLPDVGASVRLAGGRDGLDEDDPDLEPAFADAFDRLDASAECDLVVCPDLDSRVLATKGAGRRALSAARARALRIDLVRRAARRGDRVVLLDPPLVDSGDVPRAPTTEETLSWKDELDAALGADRDFAAAFHPWIRVVARDLRRRGDDTLLQPPSAHVAGRMARTALARGPWIATGNVALEGAIAAAAMLSRAGEARLQDAGLCPLRVTSRGVEIQGVRSLSSPDRPEWRFLTARRLFNHLRRALVPIGNAYAFEPNTPATWLQMRRDVEGLLRELWSRGAFAGGSMREAFFVRIDETINPPEARENGALTALIGVAPAAPLEFLTVRLVARRDAGAIVEEAS